MISRILAARFSKDTNRLIWVPAAVFTVNPQSGEAIEANRLRLGQSDVLVDDQYTALWNMFFRRTEDLDPLIERIQKLGSHVQSAAGLGTQATYDDTAVKETGTLSGRKS